MRYTLKQACHLLVGLFAGLSVAAPAISEAVLPTNSSSLLKRRAGFMRVFPDEVSMKAHHKYQEALRENVFSPRDTLFAVHNNEDVPLNIWAESNGATVTRHDEHMLRLEAGEWLLFGEMPRENGALRALIGCNVEGRDCISPEGTATKFEWKSGANGDYDLWNLDLSMVDGYNIGMTVSFAPNSDCHDWKNSCHIAHHNVERKCPWQNLHRAWAYGREWLNCQADCKVTRSGCGFDEVSNTYLKEFCPNNYFYPSDHNNESCHPGGIITIQLCY